MEMVKTAPSTLSVLNNAVDIISVTLVAQGYARVGLRESTKQKLVKVSDTIEYIYDIIELTSEYIILVTRHYMESGQFIDYIERTI